MIKNLTFSCPACGDFRVKRRGVCRSVQPSPSHTASWSAAGTAALDLARKTLFRLKPPAATRPCHHAEPRRCSAAHRRARPGWATRWGGMRGQGCRSTGSLERVGGRWGLFFTATVRPRTVRPPIFCRTGLGDGSGYVLRSLRVAQVLGREAFTGPARFAPTRPPPRSDSTGRCHHHPAPRLGGGRLDARPATTRSRGHRAKNTGAGRWPDRGC